MRKTIQKLGCSLPKVFLPLLPLLLLTAQPELSWAAGPDTSLKVPGWKREGKIQVFSPQTLYNYIDGGADLYLKYDFQELQVSAYRDAGNGSVNIEIYRHRTPNQAFGVYSQERLPNARYLDIGAQGYIEESFLNFINGPYYVKMAAENTGAQTGAVLLQFARKILERLKAEGTLPAVLSAFPSEGKKSNTEKFIAKDFLGYSFFHSGFTANYEAEGKKFQLFIIEGRDARDAAAMIKRYFQEAGRPPENVLPGVYQISDRYHGPIEMGWKGKYIWGVINLDNPELRSKYAASLAEKVSALQ